MNLTQSFYVRPRAHERVETVIHLQDDPRPALLGAVRTEDGHPAAGALVVVYRSGGAGAADVPAGALYTDEQGRFAFGPLEPETLYQVQVFRGGACRMLEQPPFSSSGS